MTCLIAYPYLKTRKRYIKPVKNKFWKRQRCYKCKSRFQGTIWFERV